MCLPALFLNYFYLDRMIYIYGMYNVQICDNRCMIMNVVSDYVRGMSPCKYI